MFERTIGLTKLRRSSWSVVAAIALCLIATSCCRHATTSHNVLLLQHPPAN